jgi:ubiquinone/menaquinone biosynthesis C-methylase UbiE
MRPSYGIDAPLLVRNFLLAGLGLLAVSGGFVFGLAWRPWSIGLGVVLLIAAIYSLGMFCLMLWDSLVTKVRGRDAILDLVTWRGDEAVLDVGCGSGLMLVGAARRLTTGHATGVDLWLDRDQASNAPSRALSNAKIERVCDRITVETGDMRALPFPDSSFDVVVSHWAVHNLEDASDRLDALTEMKRVLRPGGTILLADIALRDKYLQIFRELGFAEVKLKIPSMVRDKILTLVSFGAYQPATVIAR